VARKGKPKTPEQIVAERLERRRKDLEAVNLDPDAATLETYEDVAVERKGRRSDRNRAWRSNVFRLLLERKTITTSHYAAAYKLVEDWAMWRGLDGKPDAFGEVVDGGGGSVELVTDRMMKAGVRIFGDAKTGRMGALQSVDPLSRVILEHFMVAIVEEDRAMAWRGIMERIGITVKERQTSAVVAALEGLRTFYQEPGRVAA